MPDRTALERLTARRPVVNNGTAAKLLGVSTRHVLRLLVQLGLDAPQLDATSPSSPRMIRLDDVLFIYAVRTLNLDPRTLERRGPGVADDLDDQGDDEPALFDRTEAV